ncbi:MAG: pilus (MSHA type) biogenesis protein MshL [Gammaproteobacteria bacterium]|nr:pilus (MSHA type) biogenesis protein MshL [Gammaproteobacteria bacterium]
MTSNIGWGDIGKARFGLTLAACVATLSACQNPTPRKDNLAAMQATVDAARIGAAPVPPEVSRALVPSLKLDAHEMAPVSDQQRFDIAVNDVPARQFFMSLVDGTRYNIVVHPEVGGKISLNLKNVTIPEVIAAARDVYGYEFERTAYGFQVLPSRLDARVYQINYLNINRSGSSSMFVSAGTLDKGRHRRNGSSNNGGGDQQQGNDQGSDQRSVVGTQISTKLPATSFWQELQTSVTAIVGDGKGRSVVVNPQSGVVVVRALPTELREVETFLQAAQLIAARQVILEAKILEVELSDGFQSGINWATVLGEVTVGHTGGGTVFKNDPPRSDTRGANFNLIPGLTKLAGVPASGFGGVFSLAINGGDFGAFLELLKTQGNVQVLSSPRISTMNNQKAIIKVGTDEFFVTDVSTTTVTGTSTTSTPNIELTPFFSGIALDVTPQISRDNEVMLHIHPSVSDVQDQQKNITVSGIAQSLPLARSTVRESDSVVQAKSGQVIVIGGLMQNRDIDSDAKTPVLGDLPLIGALFRHKRTASIKSELVILLRPLVIESPQHWADALDSTQQGFKNLDRELDGWEQKRLGGALGVAQP